MKTDNWGSIVVLRDGEQSVTRKSRKARGKDDLSYDGEIDLNIEVSARKFYAVLVEDREGNGLFSDVFIILDIKILINAPGRARFLSITSEQALLTRTTTTTRRSDPEASFAILHPRLDDSQLASLDSWAMLSHQSHGECRASSAS